MGRDTLNRILTLDQWNKLGYLIIKGSKHVQRNSLGTCQFSEKQVTKKPRKFLGWQEGNDPYDEENEYGDDYVSGYDLGEDW